jgi:hypothetical protein
MRASRALFACGGSGARRRCRRWRRRRRRRCPIAHSIHAGAANATEGTVTVRCVACRRSCGARVRPKAPSRCLRATSRLAGVSSATESTAATAARRAARTTARAQRASAGRAAAGRRGAHEERHGRMRAPRALFACGGSGAWAAAAAVPDRALDTRGWERCDRWHQDGTIRRTLRPASGDVLRFSTVSVPTVATRAARWIECALGDGAAAPAASRRATSPAPPAVRPPPARHAPPAVRPPRATRPATTRESAPRNLQTPTPPAPAR